MGFKFRESWYHSRKLKSRKEKFTSTFMEYWGRAWADFCTAHYCQHSMKVVCNVNSSAQLFSMQSSSSLKCTLNWKHSFSSTCRHPPFLRVADRASASRSQRSVVLRPWLHVARACTLTLSTQQASLNPCTKSWPGLQLSIWFSFLVAAFSSLRSNGRCRLMCTCTTCYWLNRRVLGNIEATNATRSQIDRYIDI